MAATTATEAPRPSSGLTRRLVRNSSWNVLSYGVLMVVGLISTPIYIHFLGLKHYGIFVLLSSILAPFGLLNLGFGQATIKYIAESMGAGNEGAAQQYLQTTLLFNIAVGLLGAAILVLIAPLISSNAFKIAAADRPLLQLALVWTAFNWLISQISGTFAALPAALQRYKITSITQTTFTSLNVVTGVLVLWLGGGLINLIQVRLLWAVLTTLFWILVARKLLPTANLWPKYHARAFQRSFHFGIWQTVSSVGGLLANHADKFLLGVYVSATAVGLFNVPSLIYNTGYSFTSKIAEVLFPAISHLQGRGEESKLARLLIRSCWALGVIMVGVQGTFFIFADDILRLYVGHEVADAASHVLRIFAITAILSSPSVGVAQYLLGTGRTKWVALTAIVTGVLTLLCSVLLIPRFGLAGAAWSDLGAIVLSRPLLHLLMWNKYLASYMKWQEFCAFLYGPALIGMTGALVLHYAHSNLGWKPGWIGLAAGSCGAFTLLLSMTMLLDFFPNRRTRRKDFGALLNAALANVSFSGRN